MKHDFQAIKAQNPIEDVVGQFVALQPKGKSLVGLCPFHSDHNPSFTVDPNRQTFRCWSCGAKGDVIDFLVRRESITPVEAAQALGSRPILSAASRSSSAKPNPAQAPRYQAPEPDWQTKAWVQVNDAQTRLHSPTGRPCLEYLNRRGITSETAKACLLGYKPDAWDSDIRQVRSALVIPQVDGKGRVLGLKYRFLDDRGDRRYTALTGSRLLFFGLHSLAKIAPASLIIVEGELNAASILQVTNRSEHDVVSPGAETPTTTTIDYLKSLVRLRRYRTILVWMDKKDKAESLSGHLESAHIVPIESPKGTDANDLLCQQGAEVLLGFIEGKLGLLNRVHFGLKPLSPDSVPIDTPELGTIDLDSPGV